MRRKIVALLAVLIVALLAGCGGPKIGPEESMRIIFDVTLKGNMEQADKINIKDDMKEKMKSMSDKQYEKKAKEALRAWGVVSQDKEAVAQIKSFLNEAAQRTEVKTELVSKNDKEAVVKLHIYYPNIPKYEEDIVQDAVEAAKAQPETRPWVSKGAAVVAKGYNSQMDKLTLWEQPVSLEVACVPKGDCWMPKDFKKFTQDLQTEIQKLQAETEK